MCLSWYLLQGYKKETRFTSRCPANEIISKIEQAAKPLGFDVHKKNYKVMTKFLYYLFSFLFAYLQQGYESNVVLK